MGSRHPTTERKVTSINVTNVTKQMTILEEEKHTASASSAGSKDSHIATVSPSSGQTSTTCNNLVVTSGQQQVSASTAAAVVSRITSEVNAATKNHLLSNMISNVADRYITPEYLEPLPSSEKTGKSPLQLLAQTCSQIGADPGNTKLSLDKTKDNNKKSSSSPALIVSDNASPGTQVNHNSSSSRPVSFKPYESDRNNKTPSSVISLSPNSNSEHNSSTSPNSSKSPLTSSTTATSSASAGSTAAKTSTTSEAATPVIRSGMEVLAGQPKDLMSLYANPAFRPHSLGGAAAGYPPSLVPPTSLAASLAAAAAGSLGTSVCRDPYCRDPTCPTAIYNAQLTASLMASGLPPGYAELFNAHKAATAANNPTAGANGAGMFICNW